MVKELYDELPEWIKDPIRRLLYANPDFADPVECADQCLYASTTLIELIREVMPEGTDIGTEGDFWHAFVKVDKWFIDLTARQFDPNQDCPKIWTDPNENNWYQKYMQ